MTKQEFLEKYGKDHIIVYGGTSVQISRTPKTIREGERLAPIPSAAVYIDDMNFGNIERPFSCFEVDPGMHKFQIVGNFGRNGVLYTDPRPARVKPESSLMISVKSVECLSGVYFSIKEFTDLDEFLSYTGVSLY